VIPELIPFCSVRVSVLLLLLLLMTRMPVLLSRPSVTCSRRHLHLSRQSLTLVTSFTPTTHVIPVDRCTSTYECHANFVLHASDAH